MGQFVRFDRFVKEIQRALEPEVERAVAQHQERIFSDMQRGGRYDRVDQSQVRADIANRTHIAQTVTTVCWQDILVQFSATTNGIKRLAELREESAESLVRDITGGCIRGENYHVLEEQTWVPENAAKRLVREDLSGLPVILDPLLEDLEVSQDLAGDPPHPPWAQVLLCLTDEKLRIIAARPSKTKRGISGLSENDRCAMAELSKELDAVVVVTRQMAKAAKPEDKAPTRFGPYTNAALARVHGPEKKFSSRDTLYRKMDRLLIRVVEHAKGGQSKKGS